MTACPQKVKDQTKYLHMLCNREECADLAKVIVQKRPYTLPGKPSTETSATKTLCENLKHVAKAFAKKAHELDNNQAVKDTYHA